MKPQLSAPARRGKESKEATKTVSENLTALLEGKLNTSTTSPMHTTDGETWQNNELRSLSRNNRDLNRK